MTPATLLAAVRDTCRAAAQRHPDAAGKLGTILTALDRVRPFAAVSTAPLPPQVERSLATAAALAHASTGPLATALAACAPSLPWFAQRDEKAPPDVQAFQAGYAYGVLVGPSRDATPPPWASPDVRLGFAIQSPNTFYPPHAHRAVEIYGILGGYADWLRGTVWTVRSAGEFFVHESEQVHAMRTHGDPMMTLWAWILEGHSGR
jgi:hypothetical protein